MLQAQLPSVPQDEDIVPQPQPGMPLEVLFVGAGAIGAFFASRVALSPDVNVSVICRSNYQVVKANGFRLSSTQYRDYTWTPTRVFNSPSSAATANVRWDFIVVSTKALPNVSDDSKLLDGLVSTDTAIVLIQNGLGIEEPYARRFPSATILSAVTIASIAQPSSGNIKHNRFTKTNIGPYFSHPNTTSTSAYQRATSQCQQFVILLQNGGIKDALASSTQEIQLVRWHKIAINAAMNPTSVLSGCLNNATMSSDLHLSQHILGVLNEVLSIAPKIVGREFPKEFATAEQILRSSRKNTGKPSMALDWEEGRRMELEVILGNPLRLARERGMEMPRCQSMYALLRMAEEEREGKKVGRENL
jgi:2-dehydropantoate 2-reductase